MTRPWEEIKANRAKRDAAESVRWEVIVKDTTGRWFSELGVVESTRLGYEDHGILTGTVAMRFESGTYQSGGGFAFDEYVADLDQRLPAGDYLAKWVYNILRVTGKDDWEKVPGSTLYAIRDSDKLNSYIRGFASSPTHSKVRRVFMFQDIFGGAS